MDLQAHYDAMRTAATQKLARGEAELDSLIDSPHDDRRGITLLARPPARITDAIEGVMADFRQLEPDQYYYPASDVHITIMSIIACYNGFSLDVIDAAKYIAAVGTIVRASPPFTVRFSGLTASPGGIIVQGFLEGDGLGRLREKIRNYFQSSDLQQSIDTRYSIQTAHSTIVRFRQPVADTARLLEKLAGYRTRFIGSFEVDNVELVYNDWYQRAANTVLLQKYSLGAPNSSAWSC